VIIRLTLILIVREGLGWICFGALLHAAALVLLRLENLERLRPPGSLLPPGAQPPTSHPPPLSPPPHRFPFWHLQSHT